MKAAVTSLLSSEASKAQQKELLTIIDEECDRLNHLVEEAAEMARLEAGEVELHFEPTAVEDLIQEALGNLKATLAGRTVEVRTSEHLPLVRADAGRATDVLMKLTASP
jgi:K+-sensing histidine kinase KdpD